MNVKYDIYGFKILVKGKQEVAHLFDIHYSHFKSSKTFKKPSLSVIPYTKNESRPSTMGMDELPAKVKGARSGLSFNCIDSRIELLYHPKTNPSFILNFADFLMNWPDKCKAHASGVSKKGNGYIFLAPQDTGKTATALYLLKRGFSFLGDDWLIIGKEGIAYPYPKPIRIFDYNLGSDIDWCKKMYGNVKGRFVNNAMKARISLKKAIIPYLPHRLLRYGFSALLSNPIKEIPTEMLRKKFTLSEPCRISHVFWLEKNRDVERLTFKEIHKKADIIKKALSIYMYEWSEYYKQYYLVASKGKSISHVENRGQHIKNILIAAFSDIPLTAVYIPINLEPSATGEKISEFIKTV